MSCFAESPQKYDTIHCMLKGVFGSEIGFLFPQYSYSIFFPSGIIDQTQENVSFIIILCVWASILSKNFIRCDSTKINPKLINSLSPTLDLSRLLWKSIRGGQTVPLAYPCWSSVIGDFLKQRGQEYHNIVASCSTNCYF